MINIAVLITCHNRKNKTIRCLNNIFNQKYKGNIKFKVFLVDDNSSDGTNKAIKSLFPLVKIIKGNGNLFWAGGMRLAWKKALKDKKNMIILFC